jgi:hypothetical protein
MPTGEVSSVYRIKVEGKLNKRWSDWFNGMQIVNVNEFSPNPVTVLQGLISDQSALRGMLIKLWDLNLTLVEVIRIDAESIKENQYG